MRKCAWTILAVVVVPLLMLHPAAWADDTDEDGLPDDVEALLATDPAVGEEFELVAEDNVTDVEEGTEGRHDIAKLWMANVAKGRWLWAIEFAKPHTPDNSIVTLYVDTDADPLTGRPAMGCEVAYIHQGGTGFRMTFVPENEKQNYPPPRMAIVDGVVYFCADVALKQQDGRTRIRARIHCQTIVPALIRDRWGFLEIEGPGDTDREPIVLKQTATVRGVVVNENRWPIAGAEVRLILGRPGDAVFPTKAVILLADKDGKFEAEVDRGTYTLIATRDMLTSSLADGRGQRIYLREGETRELLITVRPGGAIRGTVVAAEGGAPVPAAQLMTLNGLNAIADADGKFMIQGLSPGRHMLVAVADGMARKAVEVSIEPDATEEVEASLGPGYCVRGTVRDEAGEPVPGANVLASADGERLDEMTIRYFRSYGQWWAAPRAVTDDQGAYVLRGFAAGRPVGYVMVQHNEYAPQTRTGIGAPVPGDDATTVDFTMDRGLAIMGKIIGPDGGPVVAARVNLQGGSGGARATTDASGEFTLDRIAGDRPGYVLVRAELLSPQAVPATPGRDETMPWLDIVMEPGHTAKGTVIDQNGDPVAGARLTPYARFTDDGPKTYISQAGGTDNDGVFLLGSLPAEGVSVHVRLDGYESVEDYPLKVDDVTTIIMQKQ